MHIETEDADLQYNAAIGNGAYSASTFPVYNVKNYSLSQQIYTAEEIGIAGTIKAIQFVYAGSETFRMSGVRVYLKHTDKNGFSNENDMVPIDSGDNVFEGEFYASSRGLATIRLYTPFEYDGNSNLLVCFLDPVNGSLGNGYEFYMHSADNNKSIIAYHDSVIPSLDGSNWNSVFVDTSSSRNNICFVLTPNIFSEPVDLVVRNCTEQTATLTWMAPDTDNAITGYTYQFKRVSDTAWSAEVATNGTSVTFNGLTAETDYDFRVKTLYGSNKSKCAVLRFTTATQLPHEQGFENGMGRWETVYARWGYTGIDGTVKHDGASCFTFRGYGSGQETQCLISPRFSAVAGIEVSFYHLANSENDASFYVGYSTTDSDPSSFTWGERITPTYLQWNRYERTFPAGTCYVAIQYDHVSSDRSHTLCLDDFSFAAYSAYAKPTSVTVSNLTDTNTTLSWTAPSGSPTGYTYQYKKVSTASWSAESNVSGTSVTLNSLTANTAYDFRVKARYSGGKASNYVSVRFMTEGPMVSLPISEGFENGMGGWRIVDGLYGTGIIPNHAHNGSNDFMFTVNNATSPQYLISPCLNSGTIINVTFWYKANGNASFQVGYSTTTKATTAFTWGNATSSTSEWQLYTTVFPVGIKFVAVKWTGGAGLNLDDFSFSVVEPPTTLRNASDWNQFALSVAGGWATEGKTIKLDGDFTVSTMVGTAAHPFCGTFNGQGHTLTLAINGTAGAAPFSYINGATIKNLKTTGTIQANGAYYSGLVGYVIGGSNLIQNCVVGVGVSTSHSDGGGIVGYLSSSATTTIAGCVFTGNLYSQAGSMTGAVRATTLVGFADTGTTLTLQNSLDASNIISPLGRGQVPTIINTYYTQSGKATNVQQSWSNYGQLASTTATQPSNIGAADMDYGFVKAYANGLKYDGNFYMVPGTITLADASDNSSAISSKNGYFANVTLNGRTLYKNGSLNPLCLPFSLDAAQVTAQLAPTKLMTLGTTSFSGGTLTLNFVNATEIVAGKPYVIKWTSGDNLVNPMFTCVIVSNTVASVETASIDFVGNTSPVTFNSDDRTAFLLNADGSLARADATSLNSFRAFFRLKGQSVLDVKRYTLNLGGETIIGSFLSSYELWSAANGITGAWNATDVLGIHNVFRYAFAKSSGAFANPPLLSISFDALGHPVITTPPLVNTDGYTFSILVTDSLDGTGTATTYPLNASGTNTIPRTPASARFFRLQAVENE